MIIDELIALLGFETKGEGELQKFNRGLEQAEQKAHAVARRIDTLSVAVGSFFGNIAANITTKLASAIGSLPGDMTRAAADFESLLTGIEKKSGATAEQMKAIGREILDLAMSGQLASSIEEIGAAYERGAAAGLPIDELREFALLSTKAADAFEMSAEATGNAFVGFQKVLGVAAEDLERVADLINYLADSGIADERDIVAFMDSAGALAKTVGLSVEETAALGAALVNLKVPAGEAATAMNSVLTKLIAPQSLSKKAKAAFEEVVGDAGKFAKSMAEDADAAIVGLLEKFAALDSSERAGAIAEIFGLHHADVVQQLVAGVDELKRNLTEAKNEAAWLGSLQNTYAMKLDDFWSKSQRFWNNTKGLLTILGERTLPIFGSALDAMSDYIHRMAFDGSLEKVAVYFEKALRSAKDFGENVWSAGRFIFDAADGVTELISKVTGLNKAWSTGVLGAAVVGSTATGRAGLKWLAARFPAVAGIILLEDIVAGLSGKDSYIANLAGGREAFDRLGQSWSTLGAAAEKLGTSIERISGGTLPAWMTSPQEWMDRALVRFVQDLAGALDGLANAVNALADARWSDIGPNFNRGAIHLIPGGSYLQDFAEWLAEKMGPGSSEAAPGVSPLEYLNRATNGRFRDDPEMNPDKSSRVTEPLPERFDQGRPYTARMIELRNALTDAADIILARLREGAKQLAESNGAISEPDAGRFDGGSPAPANADALARALANFRGNIAKTQPEAAAQAVINDNRVANDNRDMSQHVQVNVGGVHVQQATQAPAAVGQAVGQAAGRAAVAPASRLEATPAF